LGQNNFEEMKFYIQSTNFYPNQQQQLDFWKKPCAVHFRK